MDKGEDPYVILGVSHDASDADIKKQYRKLALRYHPDKQATEEDRERANHVFAKLADAYDTVSDPVKRYDWKQANERRTKGGRNASGSRTPPPPQRKQSKTPPPPPNRHQNSPAAAGAGYGRGSYPPPPNRPPQRTRSMGAPPSSNPGRGGRGPTHPHPPPPPRQSPARGGGPPPPPTNQHPQKHGPRTSPGQPRSTSPKRPASSPSGERSDGKSTNGPSSNQHRAPNNQQPMTRPYRDPFAVFDSVMKEEFGDDYKEEETSGWQESMGVPGLASLVNPFKNIVIGATGGGGSTECSRKEFKKLDTNNDKTLSHDELKRYIESHTELWKMLGMNLNLSVSRCIEVATDVAYSLALGEDASRPKYRKADRELTEKEFTHFHKNYVLDTKGSHEFFLRTIFAAFDANGDGVLNSKELDRFLDIFYQAKDIFKGSKRLPPKKDLLMIVHRRLDTNRDSVLDFGEIRDLLEVAAVVSATDKSSNKQ